MYIYPHTYIWRVRVACIELYIYMCICICMYVCICMYTSYSNFYIWFIMRRLQWGIVTMSHLFKGYVSIRQHTSLYVSILTYADVCSGASSQLVIFSKGAATAATPAAGVAAAAAGDISFLEARYPDDVAAVIAAHAGNGAALVEP
jgi:hypothetical protein